jgi:hypothetical protein
MNGVRDGGFGGVERYPDPGRALYLEMIQVWLVAYGLPDGRYITVTGDRPLRTGMISVPWTRCPGGAKPDLGMPW